MYSTISPESSRFVLLYAPAVLQLRVGNQEEEAFSMKDMEAGRRLWFV